MPVPSAQNFGALKDSVLRYLKLKDDTEADTLAGLAIRSALLRLHAYPIKSMLSTADLTVTTGSHEVTLPSDYNMAFSLHRLDSNDRRDGRIIQRREEDFDAVNEDSEAVPGVPSTYTVRGGGTTLEFDRTPTAAEYALHPKVRLRYFKRLDTLVTATATFSISPEIEEFIVWHARKELAPIYDAKMYPLAMQEASRALMDLIRRDTIRDEQDWF